jgi:RNA polymerase primary sigma factor
MTTREPDSITLKAVYKSYERQKCFVAYSERTTWAPDLLSACGHVLEQFDLQIDLADVHYEADVPLRQKVVELIGNARYGIYDISCWKDDADKWQTPRNVLIELGMAIVLNRPALLLRHKNSPLDQLPMCLRGLDGHCVIFTGEPTLKRELAERLPDWIRKPPEQSWGSRECLMGGRRCEHRDAHPRREQWHRKTLPCHIADGSDEDQEDFRAELVEQLGRYRNVQPVYLDALPPAEGYQFRLCSLCQTVRSAPFGIFRITPDTSAEAYLALGMSLALEAVHKYSIPKVVIVDEEQHLPSLLRGYEVLVARNGTQRDKQFRRALPSVIQKTCEPARTPPPLPEFVKLPDETGEAHARPERKSGRRVPRLAGTFKSRPMREFTVQQTRYAPPALRQEMVIRAQKLLSEIESGKSYPYQDVCFRITEYRSDKHPDLLLGADDLRNDLVQFIRRLEQLVPAVPPKQTVEALLTLEEVSKLFNVSTKMISRWRTRGLTSRRVKLNGRNQLGFSRSEVEGFIADHPEIVGKGTKVSHLTDPQKDDILRLAREMRDEGATFTDATQRIAAQLGQSLEAVRNTIDNFDQANPDNRMFPDATGSLVPSANTQRSDDEQKGDGMGTLTKRYSRSRSSVYRIANEIRAKELIAHPVDYIYNAEFDDPAKATVMAGDLPGRAEFEAKRYAMSPPKDVPAQMMHLHEWPLLTKEQEQHMFRKMNFLKHSLHNLNKSIDPAKAKVTELKKIEELREGIKAARDLLISCNQRLVFTIAREQLQEGENLDELVADGNLSLMDAVEKFNYASGHKFSTYATSVIMKSFARSIPDGQTHKERYMTGHAEVFEAKADVRTDEQEVLAVADAARARVNRLLDHLDPRTREVIRMRTGLDGNEVVTLEQIAQHFGITKEKVRKIHARGMQQLRLWAAKENIEVP